MTVKRSGKSSASAYSPALRVISSLLVLTFTFGEAAHAAPMDLLSSRVAAQNPSLIQFSGAFAKVSDIHQSSGKKLLIHIQDAHTNTGAEKNMAKTLEELITRYHIKTVFIEGGTRDDSLDFLRPLAPARSREEVAKKYLMQGELNGAEYLSLASDYDFKIQGVEDAKLYDQNLKTYAAVVSSREAVLSYIGEMDKRVESLKRQMYSKDALALDDFLGKYKKKEKDFTEYYALLSSMAEAQGVSLLGFPHFLSLKDLKVREEKIDFKKANVEQAALSSQLSQTDLSEHAEKLRSGNLSPLPFYETILTEARAKKIDLSAYPNFQAYVEYLRSYSTIKMERLMKETRILEEVLYQKTLVDEDAFYLYRLDAYLEILKNLFSLQASPEDFDDYSMRQKDMRFNTAMCLAFINRKLYDMGNYADVVPANAVLDDNKKEIEDFYRTTGDRDEVFLNKSMENMDKNNITAAVLITGGYHTPSLRQRMKERNISYAVVTPTVTEETNIKRYEKLLLGQLEEKNAPSTDKQNSSLILRPIAERLLQVDLLKRELPQDQRLLTGPTIGAALGNGNGGQPIVELKPVSRNIFGDLGRQAQQWVEGFGKSKPAVVKGARLAGNIEIHAIPGELKGTFERPYNSIFFVYERGPQRLSVNVASSQYVSGNVYSKTLHTAITDAEFRDLIEHVSQQPIYFHSGTIDESFDWAAIKKAMVQWRGARLAAQNLSDDETYQDVLIRIHNNLSIETVRFGTKSVNVIDMQNQSDSTTYTTFLRRGIALPQRGSYKVNKVGNVLVIKKVAARLASFTELTPGQLRSGKTTYKNLEAATVYDLNAAFKMSHAGWTITSAAYHLPEAPSDASSLDLENDDQEIPQGAIIDITYSRGARLSIGQWISSLLETIGAKFSQWWKAIFSVGESGFLPGKQAVPSSGSSLEDEDLKIKAIFENRFKAGKLELLGGLTLRDIQHIREYMFDQNKTADKAAFDLAVRVQMNVDQKEGISEKVSPIAILRKLIEPVATLESLSAQANVLRGHLEASGKGSASEWSATQPQVLNDVNAFLDSATSLFDDVNAGAGDSAAVYVSILAGIQTAASLPQMTLNTMSDSTADRLTQLWLRVGEKMEQGRLDKILTAVDQAGIGPNLAKTMKKAHMIIDEAGAAHVENLPAESWTPYSAEVWAPYLNADTLSRLIQNFNVNLDDQNSIVLPKAAGKLEISKVAAMTSETDSAKRLLALIKIENDARKDAEQVIGSDEKAGLAESLGWGKITTLDEFGEFMNDFLSALRYLKLYENWQVKKEALLTTPAMIVWAESVKEQLRLTMDARVILARMVSLNIDLNLIKSSLNGTVSANSYAQRGAELLKAGLVRDLNMAGGTASRWKDGLKVLIKRHLVDAAHVPDDLARALAAYWVGNHADGGFTGVDLMLDNMLLLARQGSEASFAYVLSPFTWRDFMKETYHKLLNESTRPRVEVIAQNSGSAIVLKDGALTPEFIGGKVLGHGNVSGWPAGMIQALKNGVVFDVAHAADNPFSRISTPQFREIVGRMSKDTIAHVAVGNSRNIGQTGGGFVNQNGIPNVIDTAISSEPNPNANGFVANRDITIFSTFENVINNAALLYAISSPEDQLITWGQVQAVSAGDQAALSALKNRLENITPGQLARLTANFSALLPSEYQEKTESGKAIVQWEQISGMFHGAIAQAIAKRQAQESVEWKKPLSVAYLDISLAEFKILNGENPEAATAGDYIPTFLEVKSPSDLYTVISYFAKLLKIQAEKGMFGNTVKPEGARLAVKTVKVEKMADHRDGINVEVPEQIKIGLLYLISERPEAVTVLLKLLPMGNSVFDFKYMFEIRGEWGEYGAFQVTLNPDGTIQNLTPSPSGTYAMHGYVDKVQSEILNYITQLKADGSGAFTKEHLESFLPTSGARLADHIVIEGLTPLDEHLQSFVDFIASTQNLITQPLIRSQFNADHLQIFAGILESINGFVSEYADRDSKKFEQPQLLLPELIKIKNYVASIRVSNKDGIKGLAQQDGEQANQLVNDFYSQLETTIGSFPEIRLDRAIELALAAKNQLAGHTEDRTEANPFRTLLQDAIEKIYDDQHIYLLSMQERMKFVMPLFGEEVARVLRTILTPERLEGRVTDKFYSDISQQVDSYENRMTVHEWRYLRFAMKLVLDVLNTEGRIREQRNYLDQLETEIITPGSGQFQTRAAIQDIHAEAHRFAALVGVGFGLEDGASDEDTVYHRFKDLQTLKFELAKAGIKPEEAQVVIEGVSDKWDRGIDPGGVFEIAEWLNSIGKLAPITGNHEDWRAMGVLRMHHYFDTLGIAYDTDPALQNHHMGYWASDAINHAGWWDVEADQINQARFNEEVNTINRALEEKNQTLRIEPLDLQAIRSRSEATLKTLKKKNAQLQNDRTSLSTKFQKDYAAINGGKDIPKSELDEAIKAALSTQIRNDYQTKNGREISEDEFSTELKIRLKGYPLPDIFTNTLAELSARKITSNEAISELNRDAGLNIPLITMKELTTKNFYEDEEIVRRALWDLQHFSLARVNSMGHLTLHNLWKYNQDGFDVHYKGLHGVPALQLAAEDIRIYFEQWDAKTLTEKLSKQSANMEFTAQIYNDLGEALELVNAVYSDTIGDAKPGKVQAFLKSGGLDSPAGRGIYRQIETQPAPDEERLATEDTFVGHIDPPKLLEFEIALMFPGHDTGRSWNSVDGGISTGYLNGGVMVVMNPAVGRRAYGYLLEDRKSNTNRITDQYGFWRADLTPLQNYYLARNYDRMGHLFQERYRALETIIREANATIAEAERRNRPEIAREYRNLALQAHNRLDQIRQDDPEIAILQALKANQLDEATKLLNENKDKLGSRHLPLANYWVTLMSLSEKPAAEVTSEASAARLAQKSDLNQISPQDLLIKVGISKAPDQFQPWVAGQELKPGFFFRATDPDLDPQIAAFLVISIKDGIASYVAINNNGGLRTQIVQQSAEELTQRQDFVYAPPLAHDRRVDLLQKNPMFENIFKDLSVQGIQWIYNQPHNYHTFDPSLNGPGDHTIQTLLNLYNRASSSAEWAQFLNWMKSEAEGDHHVNALYMEPDKGVYNVNASAILEFIKGERILISAGRSVPQLKLRHNGRTLDLLSAVSSAARLATQLTQPLGPTKDILKVVVRSFGLNDFEVSFYKQDGQENPFLSRKRIEVQGADGSVVNQLAAEVVAEINKQSDEAVPNAAQLSEIAVSAAEALAQSLASQKAATSTSEMTTGEQELTATDLEAFMTDEFSLDAQRDYFDALALETVGLEEKDIETLTLNVLQADGKVGVETIRFAKSRLSTGREPLIQKIVAYLAMLVNIRGIIMGASQVGIRSSEDGSLSSSILLTRLETLLQKEYGNTTRMASFGRVFRFGTGSIAPTFHEQETTADRAPVDFNQPGIGFDLGGTNLKIAGRKSTGDKVTVETKPLSDFSQEGFLTEFIAYVRAQIFETIGEKSKNGKRNSVVITIPGPVTPDGKIVDITNLEVSHPGIKDALQALQLELAKNNDIDIIFQNDANVAAFYYQTTYKIAGNSLVTTAGTGVGFAVIQDSRLGKGPMEAHIRLTSNLNAVFHEGFGMKGDLESYANGAFVVSEAQRSLVNAKLDVPQNLTAATVGGWLDTRTAPSAQHQAIAQNIFKQIGRNLFVLYREAARVNEEHEWTIALFGGISQGTSGQAIVDGIEEARNAANHRKDMEDKTRGSVEKRPDLVFHYQLFPEASSAGAIGALNLGIQANQASAARLSTAEAVDSSILPLTNDLGNSRVRRLSTRVFSNRTQPFGPLELRDAANKIAAFAPFVTQVKVPSTVYFALESGASVVAQFGFIPAANNAVGISVRTVDVSDSHDLPVSRSRFLSRAARYDRQSKDPVSQLYAWRENEWSSLIAPVSAHPDFKDLHIVVSAAMMKQWWGVDAMDTLAQLRSLAQKAGFAVHLTISESGESLAQDVKEVLESAQQEGILDISFTDQLSNVSLAEQFIQSKNLAAPVASGASKVVVLADISSGLSMEGKVDELTKAVGAVEERFRPNVTAGGVEKNSDQSAIYSFSNTIIPMVRTSFGLKVEPSAMNGFGYTLMAIKGIGYVLMFHPVIDRELAQSFLNMHQAVIAA